MDELLGKRTPHSVPAEQAVIGSMLIDPRCVPEVLEVIKADEFYVKLNRDIFETMFSMFAYGHTIDPVTVLDQMKVRGVYEDSCESYVAELMRVTPTAANAAHYIAIVEERSTLEIAARLGVATETIKKRIQRGRRIVIDGLTAE